MYEDYNTFIFHYLKVFQKLLVLKVLINYNDFSYWVSLFVMDRVLNYIVDWLKIIRQPCIFDYEDYYEDIKFKHSNKVLNEICLDFLRLINY